LIRLPFLAPVVPPHAFCLTPEGVTYARVRFGEPAGSSKDGHRRPFACHRLAQPRRSSSSARDSRQGPISSVTFRGIAKARSVAKIVSLKPGCRLAGTGRPYGGVQFVRSLVELSGLQNLELFPKLPITVRWHN